VVVCFLDQALNVTAAHQGQHHVGLAILLTQVVYLDYVGVVAQAAHGLGLTGDTCP
jgi:hypothetical protein